MMSLAKPSAANRTIFARMTSRYGDVYLRALAVSSSRSILLNSMEYGLRRGIGTSRSGVCQTKRKSTLKIRHYIYEHEYLAKSLIVVARRAFRPLQQARLCCKDSLHGSDSLAVSERAAEANLHASGRKPRLRRSSTTGFV